MIGSGMKRDLCRSSIREGLLTTEGTESHRGRQRTGVFLALRTPRPPWLNDFRVMFDRLGR